MASSTSELRETNNDDGDDDMELDTEDMYGLSLDSNWMTDLQGKRLIGKSESMILKVFLLRDHVSQPPYYHTGLNEWMNGSKNETYITVKALQDAWSNIMHPLSGAVMSALCIRFGKQYMKLIDDLNALKNQVAKDSYARQSSNMWNTFVGNTLKPLISLDTLIYVKDLIDYIKRKEVELDLIEVQVSRAEYILESVAEEDMSNVRVFKELMVLIGLPGVRSIFHETLITTSTLCQHIDVNKDDQYCSIGTVLTYCAARAARDIEIDTAVTTINLLINNYNILAIALNLKLVCEDGVSGSHISRTLCEQVYDLTPDTIFSLCCMWSRDRNGNVIILSDLEKFAYPNGYLLRVRMPIGSYILNDKISPRDSTETLYNVTSKKLFLKLRQHRACDAHLKVPTDLQIYADSKKQNYVTASSTSSISSIFPTNVYVWVFSAYVDELLEEEKDLTTTCNSRKQKKLIKANDRNTVGKGTITRKDDNLDLLALPKPKPKNADEMMDQLLSFGRPVTMRSAPFDASEADAHLWPVSTVTYYVNSVLELTEYADTFQRREINGHAFICLEEDQVIRSIDIKHPLHVAKIVSHVHILREKVLEKASIERPVALIDWGYDHVAGWLRYKVAAPACATLALRMKLTGFRLLELNKNGIIDAMGGEGSEEGAMAVAALDKLIRESQKRRVSTSASADKENSINTTEPKDTALKMRRKLQEATTATATATAATLDEHGTDAAAAAATITVGTTDSDTGAAAVIKSKKKKSRKHNSTDASSDAVTVRPSPLYQSTTKGLPIDIPTPATTASAVAIDSGSSEYSHFNETITALQKTLEQQERSFTAMVGKVRQLAKEKELAEDKLKEEMQQKLLIERAAYKTEQAAQAHHNRRVVSLLTDMSSRIATVQQKKKKLEGILSTKETHNHQQQLQQQVLTLSNRPSIEHMVGCMSDNAGTRLTGSIVDTLSSIDDRNQMGLSFYELLCLKYRYKTKVTFSIDDTRAVLQRVASLWLRLGMQMLMDADASVETTAAAAGAIDEAIILRSIKGYAISLLAYNNHNNYHSSAVAIAMVFTLGLIRYRIMTKLKTPSVDKASVLNALNDIKAGTISRHQHGTVELSRDNFRSVIEDTLFISCKTCWNKFDALTQKVDPDKKGFIRLSSVIKAFKALTPMYDNLHGLSSGNSSGSSGGTSGGRVMGISNLSSSSNVKRYIPSMVLFVTSLVCVSLTKLTQVSYEETMLQLMLSNAAATPSFRIAIPAINTNANANGSNDRSSGSSSTNMHYVHLVQCVSDLLYHAVKHFFHDVDGVSGKQPLTAKPNRSIGTSTSSVCSNHWLRYVTANIKEICHAIAKNLQVYDADDAQVTVKLVAEFFVSFSAFRCVYLQSLLRDGTDTTTTPTAAMKQLVSPSNQHHHMEKEAIQMTVSSVQAKLKSFIGDDAVSNLLATTGATPAAAATLVKYESVIAESLGFIVNDDDNNNGCSGAELTSLLSYQHDVEYYLLQLDSMMQANLLVSAESKTPQATMISRIVNTVSVQKMADNQAYVDMLNLVRKDVVTTAASVATTPTTTAETKTMAIDSNTSNKVQKTNKRRVLSVVIEEVNKVLHKQRIDQLLAYMDYLNIKALRKRKILNVLVTLWNSTLQHLSSEVQTPDKPAITPPSEIVMQTREMQKSLLEEMQIVPDIRTQQLSHRVCLLKDALSNGSIDDVSGMLRSSINHIGSLEKAILVANTDAIKLASKIISNFK